MTLKKASDVAFTGKYGYHYLFLEKEPKQMTGYYFPVVYTEDSHFFITEQGETCRFPTLGRALACAEEYLEKQGVKKLQYVYEED